MSLNVMYPIFESDFIPQSAKDEQRARIQRDTEAYLAKGGQIQELPAGLHSTHPLIGDLILRLEGSYEFQHDGLIPLEKAARRLGMHPSKLRIGLRYGHIDGNPPPPMADRDKRLFSIDMIDAWSRRYLGKTVTHSDCAA